MSKNGPVAAANSLIVFTLLLSNLTLPCTKASPQERHENVMKWTTLRLSWTSNIVSFSRDRQHFALETAEITIHCHGYRQGDVHTR